MGSDAVWVRSGFPGGSGTLENHRADPTVIDFVGDDGNQGGLDERGVQEGHFFSMVASRFSPTPGEPPPALVADTRELSDGANLQNE
jgi:hypothetical protein